MRLIKRQKTTKINHNQTTTHQISIEQKFNSHDSLFDSQDLAMKEEFTAELFAYCGINCQTCVGFLGYTLNGEKTEPCNGCRTRIKTCKFFEKYCKNRANREKIDFCYECQDFPCENLSEIDVYYKEKYGVSIIESFTHIKNKGMEDLLKIEKEKWKCPTCGGVICAQTKRCYKCKP